ncbi:MAG: hypothetical protein QOF24_1710 [Verrucomicrobiota bacterium]|jgi:hypothetical protein
MKILCVAIVLGVATLLPECIHETDQKIIDGVYRESSKIEALTVKGQNMTLQLNVTKGPRLGVRSGQYEYHVLTNRELHFNASSNDSFFVFTILDYDWIWDGTNIVRKHGQTGETVIFAREIE